MFPCHWPSFSVTRLCIKKRICRFTEQILLIPKMCYDSKEIFCFVKSKFLFRQTSKTVSIISNIAVLQNKMNISRSLKCVNALKVLRRLFQNWHLTQKRPKVKLSAHKWGGRFCGRLVDIFWPPPRPVWTPASQAPCGCARLTSSTKRPAASGRQAGKM